MAKINTDQKTWSQLSGAILGKVTAVWVALVIASIVLTAPTKALVLLLKWFWNLW